MPRDLYIQLQYNLSLEKGLPAAFTSKINQKINQLHERTDKARLTKGSIN